MIFNTSTIQDMKESLANYFGLDEVDLIEFIMDAANSAQQDEWGFNTDIFNQELDRFFENLEVIEHVDYVMCFHFSRRLCAEKDDLEIYNLKDLLLSDNPLTTFLRENGYTFFEKEGHLAAIRNGALLHPEDSDESQGRLLCNRLGYGSLEPDYCFNGLALGDSLMRNLYARRLFDGPEFLLTLAEYTGDSNLVEKFRESSIFYCYSLELPLSSVIIDGHEALEKEGIVRHLIHQISFRIMLSEEGHQVSSDDENPIIRVADDMIIPAEYVKSIKEITLEMLR